MMRIPVSPHLSLLVPPAIPPPLLLNQHVHLRGANGVRMEGLVTRKIEMDGPMVVVALDGHQLLGQVEFLDDIDHIGVQGFPDVLLVRDTTFIEIL